MATTKLDCMNKKWHAVLFITSRCNLACTHCTVRENDGKDMSLDTLKRIVDYGPKKVNIMGGEPLTYPKLTKLLDIFSGIPITIQTNALLVPKKMKFLESVRQVICSVEGMEVNTNLIRGEGVFQKVIKSVEMLKKAGIPTLLRASLWEGNLKDVPELVKLSKKVGVGVYFYPMLGKPPLNVTQQLWLFEQFKGYDDSWLDLPSYFCSMGRRSYCAAGESRLAFTAKGVVLPCQWMDNYMLGYVGDDFSIIEENADFFASKMKRAPPECIGCDWYDKCRGGCLLTPWYIGCPLRPQIKKYIEFDQAKMGGFHKTEAVKTLLHNVVTC